jgi:hypothetical protein
LQPAADLALSDNVAVVVALPVTKGLCAVGQLCGPPMRLAALTFQSLWGFL